MTAPDNVVHLGGRFLSELIRAATAANLSRRNVRFRVNTATRLYLDRVTDGKGSFHGIPYCEDPKAPTSFIVELIKPKVERK